MINKYNIQICQLIKTNERGMNMIQIKYLSKYLHPIGEIYEVY